MCVLLALPIMATALIGCKKDPPAPPPPPDPTVESIALDTTNVQKSFAYAEKFNCDGLKVTATMSDATTKDVPVADCKVSTPNMTTPGRRNVTVTYVGKTARYEITVAEKVMPPVSETSLVNIVGENAEEAYRVEADAIDMAVSKVKPVSGDSFVKESGDTTPVTSGGKYLTNFGVIGNVFGFTFNADKAYEDVTLVVSMAYGGETDLNLSSSMKMYLNYKSMAESGEIDLSSKTVIATPGNECGWKHVVIRGISVPAGDSKLLFEVVGEAVPNIDFIDFYVGKNYVSTDIEINAKKTYSKEFEEFDLEKLKTREDFINAGILKPGQWLVETARTNIDATGKNTNPTGYGTGTEISTTLRVQQDATVRIVMTAASVDSYKIKDNWQFSIDGKALENVEDKDIRDGNANSSLYWEWQDTSLGKYNLAAGDHLFIAKLIGGNCNVDNFKFEVISYGAFAESTQDSDMTVSEAGQKQTVEAENLAFSAGRVRDIPAGNAYHITSGYRSVGGIATAGNTFGFTVDALADAKATLNIVAAYGGDSLVFDNYVEMKLDDTVIATNATLTKDEGAAVYGDANKFSYNDSFKWNWKKIPVALDLTKGLHTITFTVKEQAEGVDVDAPNFDKFELIVTKYADGEEVTIPEVMKEDCAAVVNGAGTYRVEAEKADLSGVSLGKGNLEAGQRFTEQGGGKAVTSGLSVGKLSVAGNKIRVYVYSDADYKGKVSITFSMAVGDKLEEPLAADDMLSFKLNDKTLTAGSGVVFTGFNEENQYWNWEPFTLSGQSFKAGLNVLEIEIKDNADKVMSPNMDFFEFVINA